VYVRNCLNLLKNYIRLLISLLATSNTSYPTNLTEKQWQVIEKNLDSKKILDDRHFF